MAAPAKTRWLYGWTAYGMVGQTEARMNKLTREVEVYDCKKSVGCVAGSDEFFTANPDPN